MPGVITGGTERYGRRYGCDYPNNLNPQMLFCLAQVAFTARTATPSHLHRLPIRSSC